MSVAFKDFAGDTTASTDSLSASSLAAFFVAGRCEQNAVAGIGDAGVPGARVFIKNLFEKKK
jgi:hypothetical protein